MGLEQTAQDLAVGQPKASGISHPAARTSWIFRLHVAVLLPALVAFVYLLVSLVLDPSIPTATSPLDYVMQLVSGLVIAPLTVVVGLFCIRRAPGNVVGPILTLWGCGIIEIINSNLRPDSWMATWVVAFSASYAGIIWPACFFLFSYFPNGKVFPPRYEALVGGMVLLTYAAGAMSGLTRERLDFDPGLQALENPLYVPAIEPFEAWIQGLNIAGAAFAILFGIVSMSMRYRAAGVHVRQQLKWMLWGFSLFAVLSITSLLLRLVPPFLLAADFLGHVGALWLVIFPVVSIGNAILRHRLYDIDLIINRTLVYVPLTGILAGLYSASIASLQRVFVAVTGETSDAAVVITTLILASSFTPIKNALQAIVDKRFKEAPDSAKQLKALGKDIETRLSPVGLPQVSRRLLDEAAHAFGAKGGAFYLLEDGDPELLHTYGDWRDDDIRLSVPLDNRGERLGFIQLGPRRNDADYSDKDRDTLQAVADTVAHAIAEDRTSTA